MASRAVTHPQTMVTEVEQEALRKPRSPAKAHGIVGTIGSGLGDEIADWLA